MPRCVIGEGNVAGIERVIPKAATAFGAAIKKYGADQRRHPDAAGWIPLYTLALTMTVGSQHLRTAGLLAIAIGAAGSVCFLMLAAEHPPAFLLMLFVLWVVSPFALLAIAERLSTTWAFATRATLRTVMLAVACASLAVYGGVVLMQIKAKTPFFVLVPPLSWLLAVTAVSGASLSQRMRGE